MKTLILSLLVLFLLITLTLSQDTDADQRAQVMRDNAELIRQWTERRLKTLNKVEAEADQTTPVATEAQPELVPEVAAQTVEVPADAAPAEKPAQSKKDELKSKIRLALEKRLKEKSSKTTPTSRDELKARVRDIIRRKLAKRGEKKTSTKDRVRKMLGGARKGSKKVGRKARRFGRKGSKKARRFGRRAGKRFPRSLCSACKYCDKLKKTELVARCNDICERKCTKPTKKADEDLLFTKYLREGIRRYISNQDEIEENEWTVSGTYTNGPFSGTISHSWDDDMDELKLKKLGSLAKKGLKVYKAYKQYSPLLGDDDMDELKLKKIGSLAKKGLKAYNTYRKYRSMIPLDDDEFDPELSVSATYNRGPWSASVNHNFGTRSGSASGGFQRGPWNVQAQHNWDDDEFAGNSYEIEW